MEQLQETKSLVHKTCGLLNFLGGSFEIEKLENKPFAEVVDILFRNGGFINVTISKDFLEKTREREGGQYETKIYKLHWNRQ